MERPRPCERSPPCSAETCIGTVPTTLVFSSTTQFSGFAPARSMRSSKWALAASIRWHPAQKSFDPTPLSLHRSAANTVAPSAPSLQRAPKKSKWSKPSAEREERFSATPRSFDESRHARFVAMLLVHRWRLLPWPIGPIHRWTWVETSYLPTKSPRAGCNAVTAENPIRPRCYASWTRCSKPIRCHWATENARFASVTTASGLLRPGKAEVRRDLQ